MSRWYAPRTAYTIDEENHTITSKDAEVTKISGTMMGALMGLSPFDTPFTQSQRMLGLGMADLSNNLAVKTGQALEERIIDYMAQKHPDQGRFMTAEDVFGPRVGDHDQWKADFEDPALTGHVDGIISKDGQDYILEVKTVKNIDSWHGQIPANYYWQVALYNEFLTQQDTVYFAIGIVTEDDYKNPSHWVPNANNCLFVPVKIDRQEVQKALVQLREIRHKISLNHTTLPYDPNNQLDRNLLNFLRDYQQSQDELLKLTQRYEELYWEIDARKKAFRDKEVELENIKARLKDVMTLRKLGRIGSVKLVNSTTVTYNVDKIVKDLEERGIELDLTKYQTETTNTQIRRQRK